MQLITHTFETKVKKICLIQQPIRNVAVTYVKKVGDGLILILGNNEAPANYPDNTYKFRQDSSFVYFFGHSHPGYAGIIDANSGEEYFFGDDVDMDDIIWMGPQPSVKRLGGSSRY